MSTAELQVESTDRPADGDATRLRDRLMSHPSSWILLILLAIVVAFSLLRPEQFASVTNLRNVAIDASVLLVLATGATFVIITAGIDLSVGSVLVFSGVVSAKAMEAIGGQGWGVVLVGLAICVACGAAWGAFNGFLIAKARIPALIVTLGTLGMALGLALVISEGIDVRGVPTAMVTDVGLGRVLGEIPVLVIVAAAVAVVGGVVLSATRFGRHTYAIGSNPEAARRAGIAVDRHLIQIYTFAGALAGLAGFLSLARFATTTIAGHATDNLQAIAAVVLGGTSLFGGIGTILGTVVGVFIPAVLQNGFVITGVQPFWQQVAVGAVLILAVYLDQLRRRARDRRG
jgi:ribose transport system permease protein